MNLSNYWISTVRSLLVIAPHADDEILGAGSIMAGATETGARVAVVVATDGSRSDPGRDVDALIRARREECRNGLAQMLGYAPQILFLDQPDGALSSSRLPAEAEARLNAFVAKTAPDVILVTDPADAHPDHKAAFGIASRLMSAGHADQLWVMPVSQRVDRVFSPGAYQSFAVSPWADRKRAALACHTSQLDPVSGFSLAQDVLEDFTETEFLKLAHRRGGRGGDIMPAAHFDELFKQSPDPWGYFSEPYERDRFRRTLALLTDRRYRSALEMGCANGGLTERLMHVCDRVLAVDVSAPALNAARKRFGFQPGVTFERRTMPDDYPDQEFDLIVASDMIYYLGFEGIVSLLAKFADRAKPGCRFLIASYLGETNTRITGEMSAEIAIAHLPGWRRVHADRTYRLRIDVLERNGPHLAAQYPTLTNRPPWKGV